MNKYGVIGYVPPPTYGNPQAFLENIRHFRAEHELVLFSDYDWPGPILKLNRTPDSTPDPNPPPPGRKSWFRNNLIFLTAIRVASSKNWTHMIYLEEDCRVGQNAWDWFMTDEFEEFPDALMGGSVVCFDPCCHSMEATRRWQKLMEMNSRRNYPIPTYGGNGSAEKKDPKIFVNGALGIYSIQFLTEIFDVNNTITEAASMTAWDHEIGTRMWKRFAIESYDKVAHLSSMLSSYANVLTTEDDRRQMLMSGERVAIHQVKSAWTPDVTAIKSFPFNPSTQNGVFRKLELLQTLADKVTTLPDAFIECSPETKKANDEITMFVKSEVNRLVSKTCSVADAEFRKAIHTEPAPTVDIFIVSFAKDFPWLDHCLKSIARFGMGFRQVVLVVPETDFKASVARYDGDYEFITFGQFHEAPGKGHLHHQAIKCMADTYSDADFILHTDPDCVWREPFSPADYFIDGKPVLLIEPYEAFRESHPNRYGWKAVTERALCLECDYETMCRHPAVLRRDTYALIRDQIEDHHPENSDFLNYVLSQKPDYPQGFTEFNALGSGVVAWQHDLYRLIDVSREPRPHDKLIQFWSHRTPTEPQEVVIDGEKKTVVPKELIDLWMK